MDKLVILILTFILLTGCAATKQPTVGSILTETKTERDRSVSCRPQMIKVCDGPDRETVDRYENLYCKCHSRRDIEDALMRESNSGAWN